MAEDDALIKARLRAAADDRLKDAVIRALRADRDRLLGLLEDYQARVTELEAELALERSKTKRR